MRPVHLGHGDPRSEYGLLMTKKRASMSGLAQRRETLRAQLDHIETAINDFDMKAFEKEREFYEVVSRRRMRALEDQKKEEEIEKYLKETERLKQKLADSREMWLKKLQVFQDESERNTADLTKVTAEVQMKMEKLQMKKVELERNLHPERFQVADMSMAHGNMEHTTMLDTHVALGLPTMGGKGLDGEEEAFPESPPINVEGSTPGLGESSERIKGTKPLAPQVVNAGTFDLSDDELFMGADGAGAAVGATPPADAAGGAARAHVGVDSDEEADTDGYSVVDCEANRSTRHRVEEDLAAMRRRLNW